jgi:hypothetical protein
VPERNGQLNKSNESGIIAVLLLLIIRAIRVNPLIAINRGMR